MAISHKSPTYRPPHSGAWIVQAWLSFALAIGVTSLGIWHLPVDAWIRSFLGMGLLFTVGSSFSLAKTLRDMHEMEQLAARLDEARVHRLLAEHDPVAAEAL